MRSGPLTNRPVARGDGAPDASGGCSPRRTGLLTRASAAALAATALAAASASEALAVRAPTRAEASALRAANARDNGGAQLQRVRVSTVNSRFAVTRIFHPAVGTGILIYRRLARGWVIAAGPGSSGVGCTSRVPRAVARDLGRAEPSLLAGC